MLSETAVTFIIGAITTLSASVVTILIQSYVNRKDKDKERSYQQLENMSAELYSPLIFNLNELDSNLRSIASTISEYALEMDELDKQDIKNKRELISSLKKDVESQIDEMKRLLSSKFLFIKSTELRHFLFMLFYLLKIYEAKLREFIECNPLKIIEKVFDDDIGDYISSESEWLLKFAEASNDYAALISDLTITIETIVLSDEEWVDKLPKAEELTEINKKVCSRFKGWK